MKNSRSKDFIIVAAATIAIGLVLLLNPESALALICRVVGVILMVFGGVVFFSHIQNRGNGYIFYGKMFISVLAFIFGLYMIINPRGIQTVIAVVFAVILIIHGIGDIREAKIAKTFNDRRWYVAMIFGIISIVFGIVVLLRPIASVALPFRIIGGFLIFDGLSNLIIAFRTEHADARS